MKRKVIALLHVGYWTVYLLLLALVFALFRIQYRQLPSLFAVLFTSPVGLVSIAPNLVAFYASYGVLFPRLLARRRIPALITGGVVLSLSSA
ncbi:MAG: hypothetical protein ABI647_17060, partial [Gemmatimonadota bacterium]